MKRAFAALIGVQLGLLAAAVFYQPELRNFAAIGLALCVTLFAGLIYPRTRWLAAALSLPVLLTLYLLIARFVEWRPA